MPSAARLVTTEEPGLPDVMQGKSLRPRWSILPCFVPFLAISSRNSSKDRETHRVFLVVHQGTPHVVAGPRNAVQAVADHAGVCPAHLHDRAAAHPGHRLGAGLAIVHSDARDLLHRQPGALSRPFRCLVFQFEVPKPDDPVGVLLLEGFRVDLLAGHEKIFSVFEIPDKLLAPDPLGEQNMRNRRRQRPVLAGLDRQPLVGFAGGGRKPRLHHGDGGLADDIAPHARVIGHLPIGGQRVGPPDQEVLGVQHVVLAVVPVALRVERPELLRLGADGAVGDVVGRADDLGHGIIDDVAHVGVTAAQEQVLVGFVVLAQLHDLVGDGVQRFVPGDRHELGVLGAAFLGVGALHGGLDPVRVVDLLQRQMGPGAARPSIDLGALVAVDLYRPAVDDVDLLGAPGGAPLAGRRVSTGPSPHRQPCRSGPAPAGPA